MTFVRFNCSSEGLNYQNQKFSSILSCDGSATILLLLIAWAQWQCPSKHLDKTVHEMPLALTCNCIKVWEGVKYRHRIHKCFYNEQHFKKNMGLFWAFPLNNSNTFLNSQITIIITETYLESGASLGLWVPNSDNKNMTTIHVLINATKSNWNVSSSPHNAMTMYLSL